MNAGLVAYDFGFNVAKVLLNLSFAVTIVIFLILFYKLIVQETENSGILFIVLGITTFLPIVVAFMQLGSPYGAGKNILNVLDDLTIIGTFSASHLVKMDIILWLWLMFFSFVMRNKTI